jgi:hypothetical protein
MNDLTILVIGLHAPLSGKRWERKAPYRFPIPRHGSHPEPGSAEETQPMFGPDTMHPADPEVSSDPGAT